MDQTSGSICFSFMAIVTLPFPAAGDVSLLLGVKQELHTSVLLLQICKANTIHTIVDFVYFMVRVVLAADFEWTALRKQCHGCQEEGTPAFINHLRLLRAKKWQPGEEPSVSGIPGHPEAVSMGMGCRLGVHSSWASHAQGSACNFTPVTETPSCHIGHPSQLGL